MIAVPEIRAARERIADALLVTPCIPAPQLSQELGAEVRVKCESLQRTGSFEPRGAFNKMLQLPPEVRQRGVICASAGNHAQAVAFDDEQVIAGQGTIGLELLEQFPEVDTVVSPIGGGGLISGIALAIKAAKPQARVYGVQTEACPSMERSFRSGTLVAAKPAPSIAEGITVETPGGITVELVRRLADDVVLVSETGS